MDLALSEDQQATRDLLRRLFQREVPSAVVRSAEALGHSPQVWATLAAAGIPAMGLPQALGGGGADLPMLVVVAIEAGRVMAPVPLIEHLVATRVLGSADPGHPRLADLAAGTAIGAFAPAPASAGCAVLVPGGAVAD